MNLLTPGTSCKYNHTVLALLYLAYFTSHNVFEIQTYCCVVTVTCSFLLLSIISLHRCTEYVYSSSCWWIWIDLSQPWTLRPWHPKGLGRASATPQPGGGRESRQRLYETIPASGNSETAREKQTPSGDAHPSPQVQLPSKGFLQSFCFFLTCF